MTGGVLARWQRYSAVGNSHLLTALAFTLPFPPPASNVMAGLLCLGWLLGGRVRESWHDVRANPVAQAAGAFLLLHGVGLLWTEHLGTGLEVLAKEWKFLLLPICMACARPEHLHRYLDAFVCAMAIAVALSFAIHLEVLPPFNKATVANPVPFATHVVYSPLLAFAIYLVLRRALFDEAWLSVRQVAWTLLAVAMAVSMFLTIGRTGQAALCVLIAVLCWQRFGRSWRTVALAVGLVGGTLALAFAASDSFRARALAVATGDANLGGDYDISIDERPAYARNALAVFVEHPMLGVGTGDLGPEMRRVHEASNTPVRFRENPHNMYLAVGGRFGLLGLVCLGWLFWAQFRAANAVPEGEATRRQVGQALPILFLVLCLGESHLALHTTALLFCVFSGFLYRANGRLRPA